MSILENKQDQELVNTLITLASSSTQKSSIPESKTGKPTVLTTLFDVLSKNPYKYTQSQLFYQVHISRLKKNPQTLKLDRYKLQRSPLCSLLGWSIHGNIEGQLTLIPGESKEYEGLLLNSGVRKKNAYNKY